MIEDLDVYLLLWIVVLFVICGILGMVLGAYTSMRTSRRKHAIIMREKCVCPCHGTCACHPCGKSVDKSI